MQPSLGSVPSWVSAPDPRIYLTGTYCVLDFETTTEAKGFAALQSNHIVSTCWKLSTTGETKFVYGNEDELIKTSFCSDVASVDFLVGQKINFEIQWFIRLGLPIQDFIYYDTSIGMAVQLGNREKRGRCNLDSLARAYSLPFQKPPISKYMEFFPPSCWPISWVQRYNRYDVRVTEQIFLSQVRLLERDGLLPTFYAKCLFTPVVAEIEYVGMHFDTDVVLQYCKQLRQQQMLLKAQWAELCPGVSVTSSKQIGALLYDELKLAPIKDYKGNTITTKTKKLPTGSGIILQLKPVDERSTRILEIYKELKTITSLFSKVWKVLEGAAKEGKSTLYFSLNQTITATHRLSSTKRQGVVSLQGQNLPRKYSPIFCSRHKDWLFGEIDFAQFEFRAGVSLANDQQGIIDIQDPNFDIHVFSANQIFKLGLSKFDKKQIPSALRTGSKKECVPIASSAALTPSGWKSYNQLSENDTILTYNSQTNSLEWGAIQKLHYYDKAAVYTLNHKHSWKVTATSEHRWIGFERERFHTNENTITERTTQDIKRGEFSILTTACYVGGIAEITAEDAARLGWLWSDGSISWSELSHRTSQGRYGGRRGVVATIIQKKYTQEVSTLFDSMATRVTIQQPSGCHVWHLKSSMVRELYQRCKIEPNKIDYTTFILSLRPSVLQAFVTAVCLAEGSLRSGGIWRISQNSGPFCEAIKLAGYLLGYHIRVGCRLSYTDKINEQITLRTRRHVTTQRLQKTFIGEVPVWCPQVANGAWVMKQGETITITGNSFGPMYGKTSGSPAQKAYQQAWKERYKELYAMQEGWCWKVLADKKLTLPTGMIFYWPNVSIDEGYGGKTYIRPKTEIYNHPIQYFATSEGSTAGIVSLWHRMKSLNTKSFLVNTKHDSVEMEIHPEEKELMEALSMEAFEKDVAKLFQSLYNYTWSVPLASEMTIEKWWNGKPKNCGCNPLINCEH